MMYQLLKLLEGSSKYTNDELAAMLGTTAQAVAAQIRELEEKEIIRGYTTIVDWEKTECEHVSARIEVKVTPKKDRGFEELADQIAQLDEVQSLYLMSGGYDLAVTIVGRTFQDIAQFVAYRLAPMDSVQSTSTHFILRKYKEKGVRIMEEIKDDRGVFL